MIDLQKPTGWLDASLPEMWSFIQDVRNSREGIMQKANVLEQLGAKSVPDKLRNLEGMDFDADLFADLEAVMAGRIEAEKPDPDDLLGKLPEHSSTDGFEQQVYERVQFLQQHGYPTETITAAQQRLLGD